jgi:hypothetical protein
MRRMPTALIAVALLAFATLVLSGCGDDDSSTGPPAAACPLIVTSPDSTADPFFSNQCIDIRWEPSGTGTVDIFLLKSGEEVGRVTPKCGWTNQGYACFFVDTMGKPSGDDFSLRVAVRDPDDPVTDACDTVQVRRYSCEATVDVTLINTIGCVLEVLADPDTVQLNADDSYEIKWFGENTTSQVDIELWERQPLLQQVYVIAQEVPAGRDTNSYTWDPVATCNRGTGSDYFLKLMDSNVEGCETFWGPFQITDEIVCSIIVDNPTANSVWNEGDMMTITFNTENASGLVNIRLYVGNELVPNGFIADNVDAAAGEYTWQVNDFDYAGPTNTSYRIAVIDADDACCVGRSDSFTINR